MKKSYQWNVPVLTTLLALAACAPEVGSTRWCEQMEEKDKGDWTANEARDYLEYCVLGGGNKEED